MDHQARSRSENASSGKIGTLARGISAERQAVVRPRISLGGVGTSVATIELRAAPPIDSLGCGWGWAASIGRTTGVIGLGTVFPVATSTTMPAPGSNIPTQIGAGSPAVGVIHGTHSKPNLLSPLIRRADGHCSKRHK
jgi:hypothetical protein